MKNVLTLLAIITLGSSVLAQKVIHDPNAEKRNCSGYHAIEVSGGIDLYLSQGDESVAVAASESRFRDRISTEVKNGVLIIRYDNNSNMNFTWGNKKLKAYVSFKDLDKLQGSGGSDIFVEGSVKLNALALRMSGGADFFGRVEAGELKVNASGGSDVKMSGSVKNLDIEASGGSDFLGYELAADVCSLQASGGSDIYITVNKELSAMASGGSDIHYKGEGVIKEIKSGGASTVKKVSK